MQSCHLSIKKKRAKVRAQGTGEGDYAHRIMMITVHLCGTFKDAIHLNQAEPNINCGVVLQLKEHPWIPSATSRNSSVGRSWMWLSGKSNKGRKSGERGGKRVRANPAEPQGATRVKCSCPRVSFAL